MQSCEQGAGPQGSSRGGEASKDVKSLKLFAFPGLKEQKEEMVLSEKVGIWAVEEQLAQTYIPGWPQLLQKRL